MGSATISPAMPLSVGECADFAQLETTIDQGRETFCEVVKARQFIKARRETFQAVIRALQEINRRRLYRAEYPTFDLYCRRRWGFSRQRGYQLISAARVSQEREAEGLPAPRSEYQARRMITDGTLITAEAGPEKDRLQAKRISATRPGVDKTAKIETLVGELRRLHAAHPWRTRADELLDLYEATVLPWPAAS
jgi:hypothetical protein